MGDVRQVALGVARWAARQVIPASRKRIRDQLGRAADSMVLNIAEGAGHDPGESRRHHFGIAAGSAAELCAILDLVVLPGAEEQQVELRRVGAMLARMTR